MKNNHRQQCRKSRALVIMEQQVLNIKGTFLAQKKIALHITTALFSKNKKKKKKKRQTKLSVKMGALVIIADVVAVAVCHSNFLKNQHKDGYHLEHFPEGCL